MLNNPLWGAEMALSQIKNRQLARPETDLFNTLGGWTPHSGAERLASGMSAAITRRVILLA